MSNNKYKNLAKNTAIFAIGTFGSKILTYLIVPLYTYVLTTEDYGAIDLFTTAISLMLPFTTLVIYESVIRFFISKEIDEKCAVTSSFIVFLFGIVLIAFSVPLIVFLLPNKSYTILYIVSLIFYTYNQIFSQYLRACGKSVPYSTNGIIVTIVTLISNIVFLLFLKMGVYGYLYSLILGQFLASIQCTIAGNVIKNISFKSVNKDIIKKMLVYCVPLIPNNLMWWIMNAGDKYIINYFLGMSYNGLYSLAIKIPTILNLMYSIFMQAWQLSAIQENGNKDQDNFYSNIYSTVIGLIIISSSIIIITVKPIFSTLISNEFFIAWKYVPLLCIAMIISCMATFMGVTYMLNKDSKKSFYTTFIGASVNILFNFLLIKNFDLYGVAIGTAIGYLVIYYIRARDTKKSTGMSLDTLRIFLSLLILIFQSVLLNINLGFIIWCIEIVLLFIIILLYKSELLNIINLLLKSKLKNRGNF